MSSRAGNVKSQGNAVTWGCAEGDGEVAFCVVPSRGSWGVIEIKSMSA